MKVDTKSLKEMMILINEASGGKVQFEDISKIENGDELDFYGIEDLVSADEILKCIIDNDKVRILFPGEDDYFSFRVAEFISQSAECKNIYIDNNSIIHTSNLAIQLVDPVSEMAHLSCYRWEPLCITTDSGIKIQLKYYSLPVAVYASAKNTYEARELGPLTSLTLIEADFSKCKGQKNEQAALDLVSSYLFELASSHDIVFSKTSFIHEEDEIHPEKSNKSLDLKFKPLEVCNDGIHLYLAASQVYDPSLRFFSFYKVLEYFAPIVLNLEVHDELRKKLDSHHSLKPNGQFINEILQISKSFDVRRNDRDQIKSLLLTCVDLIGLNQELPNSLQKLLSYDTDKKQKDRYARDLAECICSTRNQVAHAKANYQTTGTECPSNELEKLTHFIEMAASETIRWYNRLPDHQRIDYIQ
ncbi:hypothetical protein [Gimesia maris]|uniref:hypothetical protein n=1 Tax=Gimesia maris TaxID=122 RepID=UPI0032EB7A65